ncbi:hypothetical protein JCM24511_00192 [Saitozyma sp. JCM 24511]|nr:hypothetical protein JCM24511_00192 [Saitozyma sp. JCM 24511]
MSSQQAGGPSRRKAGGAGKKGKVFLEDKSGLLSLMSSITSSKEAIAESRVSKLKAKGVGAGGESQGSDGLDGAKSKSAGRSVPPGGEKKKKSGDKKKEERAKALSETKQKILERAREKKAAKKGKSAAQPSSQGTLDAQPKKKRVGPRAAVGFSPEIWSETHDQAGLLREEMTSE